MDQMRKTIVYIDGFNLYYALKKHNAKWLDLESLCKRMLTDNDIVKIKYFTARVKSRVGDIVTHLLIDGFKNLYDVAAVITNDSDLKLPIGLVRSELHKTIGVLCPHERPSRELIKQASFFKPIKKETFLECQLPEEIKNRAGMIRKPSVW